MGKSEFQRVLESHLGQESSSQATIKNGASAHLDENVLSYIQFAFGPVGTIKPTGSYAKHPQAKIEIPVEVKPTIEVVLEKKVIFEKMREKRKFTFDQIKAIKIFAQYGSPLVTEYSTDDEIKFAYRKLAKTFHPDFNKNGAEIFKEISLAYVKLIK